MQQKDGFPPLDQMMNRRSFLKKSGLLVAGAAAAGCILSALVNESVRFTRGMYKVSRTRLGIGTLVSATLIHESRDRAEEAVERAYLEMDRLVAMLNRFDDASALACLNRDGRLRDAPPELVALVTDGIRYNRLSRGAFEMTVKPVVDLFMERMGGEDKAPPSEEDIERLLPLVGSEKVRVERRSLALGGHGMGITLDGIAKGFIVDRAAEVLDRHGIENYLLAAGGEIRTRGARADRSAWTVAIQDPGKKGRYPDLVQMKDGSISTSGNYEVYFDREKTYHHIVDPVTGHSPARTASVSVIAASNTAADALTKPVFVMEPRKGVAFIDSLPGCECLLVLRDGSLLKSRGWKGARA